MGWEQQQKKTLKICNCLKNKKARKEFVSISGGNIGWSSALKIRLRKCTNWHQSEPVLEFRESVFQG